MVLNFAHLDLTCGHKVHLNIDGNTKMRSKMTQFPHHEVQPDAGIMRQYDI